MTLGVSVFKENPLYVLGVHCQKLGRSNVVADKNGIFRYVRNRNLLFSEFKNKRFRKIVNFKLVVHDKRVIQTDELVYVVMVAAHYRRFGVAEFVSDAVLNKLFNVTVGQVKNRHVQKFPGHDGLDVVFFIQKKLVRTLKRCPVESNFVFNVFRRYTYYVDRRRIIFEDNGRCTGHTFSYDKSFLHGSTSNLLILTTAD